MKKKVSEIMFIILILLIQSCSANRKNDYSAENKELLISPFIHIGECFDRTQGLINEWHDFGSSLHHSIIDTRKSIIADNGSELSRLIKSAWEIQRENGYYENLKNIGKWPVSHEMFMIVSEAFLFSKENKLGDCGALAMWNKFMSEEFDKLSNKLKITTMKEFPDEIEWVYPDNMLWLKYWIFVNIKD